jgi:hypothetical protein
MRFAFRQITAVLALCCVVLCAEVSTTRASGRVDPTHSLPQVVLTSSNSVSSNNAANNEVRALWVVRTTLTSPEKIRQLVTSALTTDSTR